MHASGWTSGTQQQTNTAEATTSQVLLLLSGDKYDKAYRWHYYYCVNSLEKYLEQYHIMPGSTIVSDLRNMCDKLSG